MTRTLLVAITATALFAWAASSGWVQTANALAPVLALSWTCAAVRLLLID